MMVGESYQMDRMHGIGLWGLCIRSAFDSGLILRHHGWAVLEASRGYIEWSVSSLQCATRKNRKKDRS